MQFPSPSSAMTGSLIATLSRSWARCRHRDPIQDIFPPWLHPGRTRSRKSHFAPDLVGPSCRFALISPPASETRPAFGHLNIAALVRAEVGAARQRRPYLEGGARMRAQPSKLIWKGADQFLTRVAETVWIQAKFVDDSLKPKCLECPRWSVNRPLTSNQQ